MENKWLTEAHFSFIPYRRKTQYSLIYVDKKHEKGALYLGSPKSESRFAIYDKARQLRQKYKTVIPKETLLRIEARSRPNNISFLNLVNMANPFVDLKIVDVKQARNFSSDPDWQQFISDCLDYGSPYALMKLTKPVRSKYTAILDNMNVPWWNPEKIWSMREKAILRLITSSLH